MICFAYINYKAAEIITFPEDVLPKKHATKGYATRNDIVPVDDFVTMSALDGIFATLKSIIVDDIVSPLRVA